MYDSHTSMQVVRMFARWQKNVDTDEGTGRLATNRTDNNTADFNASVRKITISGISDDVQIIYGLFFFIVTEDSRMRCVSP